MIFKWSVSIESCKEVRCEEGKKCVVRKGRPRCVCSPECKAPRGGGPVCGTDGKSYKNLCRLKKRACKKGSHELAVAYNGHCQSEYVWMRWNHYHERIAIKSSLTVPLHYWFPFEIKEFIFFSSSDFIISYCKFFIGKAFITFIMDLGLNFQRRLIAKIKNIINSNRY